MGMATPSRAFCFSSYSSFSALWFASSQEMASSMAFLASMRLRLASSSALYFSASETMRSISSWERRPLSLVMVIFCSLPVDFSTAETLRMPLASMSKVTSIWGWPRGMGGIPSRLNFPRMLLSRVMERSPSKTWMRTPGWLSAEEELGELLGLVGTGEDGGLDGGAEGDGLVGVDGLARLLSVEEVGEEALDLGDAGGSSDEDDLIDASLGDLGIAQDLLDGVHALLEVVHAQVLETGAGDG